MPSSALSVIPRRPQLAHAGVVVLGALSYVTVLHVIYAEHVAPRYSYLQYAYRAPDAVHYGLAVGLVVALALVLPRRLTHPSHFIAWVLFVLLVAPTLTVSQYVPALGSDKAFELALWVGGCFSLIALLGTRQILRGFLPSIAMKDPPFWWVVAALFVGLNLYVLASIGVNTDLPSLDDVYGVRGEFRQEADLNPTLGYLGPLLATVVNPLMMVRGLWQRRWLWLAAGVFGQLYLYAAQGNKTALLSPVAVAAAFLLLRRRRPPPAAAMLFAAPVLSLIMLALDWLTASYDWTSLLVRRLLVTPSLITIGYVQVFGDIEKAHLGHSVFSSWVTYPYGLEPPDLVGVQFFGNPSTHANGSWLADGFANFGYPGMLAASIVVMGLLWTIDDATRGVPAGAASLLFLMPAMTLAEAAVLTSLLTHGYFAAIVLCLLMPRDGWVQRGVTVDTPIRDRGGGSAGPPVDTPGRAAATAPLP